MRADQLALQLYTVRDACARDFLGTLREVAAMGYPAVELAGLHGHEPARVRDTLDQLALRAVSAHVGLDRFEQDLAGVTAELLALGCEFAVVPWVPEPLRRPEAMAQLVAKFHRWAAALKGEGIIFAYHNHDFEFRGDPGATLWDLMLAESDPALVSFELDVFWAAYAGHDPAAVLGRAIGRVPLVHLKDMEADGKRDAPAGAGTLDWPAIIAAADAGAARRFITEQDHPRSPLEDARRAYELMAARAGTSTEY
jgi:sugar phosphate isomerase/epimerase